MAILSGTLLVDSLWNADNNAAKSRVPILLAVGDTITPGTATLSISSAPANTEVRLRLYDPSTGIISNQPPPTGMFAYNHGMSTDNNGNWSTDISNASSHGITVVGQYRDGTGPDDFHTTDNYKIVLISATPINVDGCVLYYSSAVGERHTPNPPVPYDPVTWPSIYAQRLSRDLETAFNTYLGWGFPALYYTDPRYGGKQRVVIFNLYDAFDSNQTGVTIPEPSGTTVGLPSDCLTYLDADLDMGAWPVFTGIAIEPNAFSDSIAAHELFHNFQFRILYPPQRWIAEATANWAFSHLFPDNDWYIIEVDSRGRYFDRLETNFRIGLDSDNPTGVSLGYSRAIFFKYLVDFVNAGSPSIILEIWQRYAAIAATAGTATQATADVLASPSHSSNLPTAFGSYATTNWLRFGIDPNAYNDDLRVRYNQLNPADPIRVPYPPNLRGVVDVPSSGSAQRTTDLMHLAPSYWGILAAPDVSKPSRLIVTVSGSDAGLSNVSDANRIWRVQATRIPPDASQEIHNFAFQEHDAAQHQFIGNVAIDAFGPSGSGAAAALIVSNVTYTPNNITGARDDLAYDINVTLE